jgi:hypothetical protein
MRAIEGQNERRLGQVSRSQSHPLEKAMLGTEPLAAMFLTVVEVAGILRTTPKAIYSMIERGQLPGERRIGVVCS